MDLFSLQDRVILLTGAAGYLGSAMAKGLISAGASVILAGRTPSSLEQLAATLGAEGGKVSILECDVGDAASRDKAIDWLHNKFSRLDGMVNNAYSGRVGVIEDISSEDFSAACAQNLAGPFHLIQGCIDLLEKAEGDASIVNISSMYGKISPDPGIYGDSGQNNPVHYGATKGGLIQMTRYLACHLATRNIRVNSLSPGAFPRPEVRQTAPDFLSRLEQKIPMSRIGESGEVVGPLLFLLSPAASYVTGIDLAVDGGWTAW